MSKSLIHVYHHNKYHSLFGVGNVCNLLRRLSTWSPASTVSGSGRPRLGSFAECFEEMGLDYARAYQMK